ncbi:DUF4232 domain-containing protein [Embleya sp. NPDC059237]|uniref:DUF4232 domain-containing protein n=1 Tax=Embleya sp. NPDC059237 TaxID=3346784 RepID=UPI003679B3E5
MTADARVRWAWGSVVLISALLVGATACGEETASRSAPRGVDGRSGPATAPESPDAATCPPSGLRITADEPDAAMGLRAMTLTMSNCGESTRTVSGYPDIRVVGADGTRLDVAVEPGAASITRADPSFQAPPQPVTLPPGARAIAGVVWRNTVTDGNGPAANGRYLDVTPLTDQPAQHVQVPGGLDVGNTGRVGTAPWCPAD